MSRLTSVRRLNNTMDVRVTKDRKGSAYIVSHKRCGITECVFLTADELRELYEILRKNADI